MKPLKTKVNITLDNDLVDELRLLAEKDDRPLSQYINVALKKHVRKADDKKARIDGQENKS